MSEKNIDELVRSSKDVSIILGMIIQKHGHIFTNYLSGEALKANDKLKMALADFLE